MQVALDLIALMASGATIHQLWARALGWPNCKIANGAESSPVRRVVMQGLFRSLTCVVALSLLFALDNAARANSGIQLPLNQYAPGSETATNVTNGNFEAGATGWTASG